MSKKPIEIRKCKYEGCNNPSAKGKTVCWMHSKREYRANVKLKKNYQKYTEMCKKNDCDPMDFDTYREMSPKN